MSINRGDIYYVEPTWKERGDEMVGDHPAVIVSNEINNIEGRTFLVVFLTSKIQDQPRSTDVMITSSNRVSTALCHQVTTVSAGRIKNYLGKCTDDEMMRINTALMDALSLTVFDAPQSVTRPKKKETPLQRIRPYLDAYNEAIEGQSKANYAAQLAGVLDFVLSMEDDGEV